MESAVVRPARVADAPRIAQVHVRSWQGAYRGKMPQDFLDRLDVGRRVRGWTRILTERDPARAGVLVAEDETGLAGFVSYTPTRDDADSSLVGEIEAIYLLPAAWSTGVGRRLMARAVEALTAAGYSEATLWVLESNDRARRFYAAAGWSPDGTVKEDADLGFPVTEVRYRRSLP